MKLVKATSSDISSLKQICEEAYTQNFSGHWEASGIEIYLEKEFNEERLNADISDLLTDYFFINVQNLPIGFVKIKYEAPLAGFAPEKVIELLKIYVLPRCKGMGYGRFALQEIIKIAEEKKKEAICLSVLETNYASIKFYEKNSFTFHGTTRLDAPLFKEHLREMKVLKYEV